MFPLGAVPVLSQPCKYHRLIVLALDVKRLFGIRWFPLIEAVSRDQAPLGLEGVAEGGLIGHSLSPGIDHPVAHLFILGPEWDQPPVHGLQHLFSPRGELAGQYVQGWSYVVAWGNIKVGIYAKQFGIVLGRGYLSEAATHIASIANSILIMRDFPRSGCPNHLRLSN